MGLLDDLKQQADSILLRERSAEEDRVSRVKQAHERMHEALQYWIELFKALNVLKPQVVRNYFVEGSTTLYDLAQCDYNVNSRRITVDHHDYIDSIELRFRCVSNEKVTIEKESDRLVTRLREHLWQHGLKFELREVRREGAYVERGVFTVLGEVTPRLTFGTDVAAGRVNLTLRNLERLGEYTYSYDFDEFGRELFEEIGKAILAQPNRLRRMGRHQAEATGGWSGPLRRSADSSRVAAA